MKIVLDSCHALFDKKNFGMDWFKKTPLTLTKYLFISFDVTSMAWFWKATISSYLAQWPDVATDKAMVSLYAFCKQNGNNAVIGQEKLLNFKFDNFYCSLGYGEIPCGPTKSSLSWVY